MSDERITLESRVRELAEAGSIDEAAALAIEQYGPEIHGYVAALMHDADVGWDVFQQFSEDLWQGLAGFRWGSSLRTWCYVLARNASHRYRRAPYLKRRERLFTDQISRIVQSIRTTTRPHLKADASDWLSRVREELTLDEQTLLTLRIDRRMPFEEIAQIMADPGESLKSATVRKRFERVKQKLRELAERDGLKPPETDR